jgi:Domain of unknown function (DUF4291)
VRRVASTRFGEKEAMTDMPEYEIRADYDERTVVVYQAYRPEVALPAVRHNRFVPPFSLTRMTWIKPSFLWMMERSNWARKPGQEHVLAIRITCAGWEEALTDAIISAYRPGVYRDEDDWRRQMDQAHVVVQWDPERTIRGASLPYKSIQVGLSRHIIQRYVEDWTVEIRDITSRVHALRDLIQSGHTDKAKAQLPRERVYPLPPTIAHRLGMT